MRDLLHLYSLYGNSPILLSMLTYPELLSLSIQSPSFSSYYHSLQVVPPVTNEQAIVALKNSLYLWNKKPVVYEVQDIPVDENINLIIDYIVKTYPLQQVNKGNLFHVITPIKNIYLMRTGADSQPLYPLTVESEGTLLKLVVPEYIGFIRNIPVNYYEDVIPNPIHFQMRVPMDQIQWELEMIQDQYYLKGEIDFPTTEYNSVEKFSLVYPLLMSQVEHLSTVDTDIQDYIAAQGVLDVFSTQDELYGLYPSGPRTFFVPNFFGS